MRGKIIAGFEGVLIIVSLFALCHFISLTDDTFALVSAEEGMGDAEFQDWLCEVMGRCLIQNTTWSSYPISANAGDLGCCLVSKDGQVCGTASPDNCVDDAPFAEGALCATTSFCEKGCCYDEALGIYDRNTLKVACPTEWTEDPNCNMPGAAFGCCVIGTQSNYETEGQCRVNTLAFGSGEEGVMDWRRDVGEVGCFALGLSQKEGACLLGGGNCKFITEAECFDYGDFAEGVLCSSPSLNTSCEMTEQTKCVDGKDGVYFVDSCGQAANIYDSARVNDVTYWDGVLEGEDVCGDDDVAGGNANSESCGNCNRFLGGICGSAAEDGFEPDVGSFYCADTSCMFKGEGYENGESWCVYDGAIGNGDDVVGSRHWKYVCSQGTVAVEPCADYRNQICIQSDAEDGVFRNAACVANNWRACIDLNSEGDIGECGETLNCRVETVDIASNFKFDVCLPKYPGGFSLSDERYQVTAERLCGMADQTCTVVYTPKTWGGCEVVANEGCLSARFAEEMNDFCRGLGDCGGSANVIGEWSDSYKVRRSGGLSSSWVAGLVALANPVPGQIAEVEDYSEFLEAAGILGGPGVAPEAGEVEEVDYNAVGMGLGGIGLASTLGAAYAIGTGAGVGGVSGGISGIMSFFGIGGTTTAAVGSSVGAGSITVGAGAAGSTGAMAAFGNVAIGAAIGAVAGSMIAKQLGLSHGGSMLMSAGGAMVGAAAGMAYFNILSTFIGPLLLVGVFLIVLSLFFGGDDCSNIEVQFECNPWRAPFGGDDCDECNGNLLKPCSEYRCESLGATCELVNKGTEDEICDNTNPNDVTPPVIIRQRAAGFEGGNYEDGDDGFSVVGSESKCVPAYTPLAIGIVTDELAICRFDVDPLKEFEDMDFDLGGSSYLYNHTAIFPLPDPSHGQSQGVDWNGELSLFVKCADRNGIISPGLYTIDMCVTEGDDVIAPSIVGVNPQNGGIVGFDIESVDVEFVTGELASCRWSQSDKSYLEMENEMSCEDSFERPSNPLGYVCTDSLPLGAGNSSDYSYYVRCGDQPWLDDDSERNFASSSFVYSVRKPEKMIEVDWVLPNEDFEVGTVMTTIDLEVGTSGGGDFHFCSYSFSGYETMIEMFETGNGREHSQTFNRPAGNNEIFVECRDETGDSARGSTSFEIVRDSSAPAIARVWQNGGRLYILTNEDSECVFSDVGCGFAWDVGTNIGDGKEHIINVIQGHTYFVRCKDEFGISPPGCSVTLQAM